MSELISVTPEVSASILWTQTYLEASKHMDFLTKALLGELEPNPPLILSEMPENYHGRFKYHLYDGAHRFTISRKVPSILNGLVVAADDEIPRDVYTYPIETRLRLGLYHRLNNLLGRPGRPLPQHSLEFLLNELEVMEQAGRIGDELPLVGF